MQYALALASLWLGIAQSEQFIAVTGTVENPPPAVATGTTSARFVPFNVDYTAQKDWRTWEVFDTARTSTWKSTVSVHDDGDKFVSFVSLEWPEGEGPGAPSVGDDKQWNACVLFIPDLYDHLGLQGPGNGSCFDIVSPSCLADLTSYPSTNWNILSLSVKPLTAESAATVCRALNPLPLSSFFCTGGATRDAFGNQLEAKAYPFINPPNGQPFILAADEYGDGKDDKSTAHSKALSRAWPLIILEAEQYDTVWATMTCPFAEAVTNKSSDSSSTSESGFFTDDFASGSLDGWKVLGGEPDASSKALVGNPHGGRAIIDGHAFDNFTYDVDMQFSSGATDGSAGLIFRVSNQSLSADSFLGYFAGFDTTADNLVLGLVTPEWNPLGQVPFKARDQGKRHVRLLAYGDSISMFVDDMDTPKIAVKDATYTGGSAGVSYFDAGVTFDNVDIKPVTHLDNIPGSKGGCADASQDNCGPVKTPTESSAAMWSTHCLPTALFTIITLFF